MIRNGADQGLADQRHEQSGALAAVTPDQPACKHAAKHVTRDPTNPYRRPDKSADLGQRHAQ